MADRASTRPPLDPGRKPDAVDPRDAAGLTVVVPTVDRGEVLSDCVADLLAQHHRPLEILIVDQSRLPNAEMVALARRHPDVLRYHHVAFRNLPAARNLGWRLARHDAVLYVDDDVRCGPTLAAEHLRALRGPGIGIVAGGIDDRQRGAPDVLPRRLSPWTALAPPDLYGTGEGEAGRAVGCNFSAWRRVLVELGGFDEALGVGAAPYEETELCLRALRRGYRIRFNGRARVTHLQHPTGGVRAREAELHAWAMAHNRSLVIRRHLRPYRAPVALGRLLVSGVAIACRHRVPRAVIACCAGMRAGWARAGEGPLCTAGHVSGAGGAGLGRGACA